MRLDHPIFKGPLRVELDMTSKPTPKHYRGFGDGVDLPDDLPCWRVHEKDYPEIEPGLVCTSWSFEDTPDCEWISGGINSKNVNALAIARQANVFYWGFSGTPADMTPSARSVMVNAIAYMDQFDGSTPLLGKAESSNFLQSTRDQALTQAVALEWRRGRGESDPAAEQCFPEHVLTECGQEPGRVLSWYREHLEFLVPAGCGYDVDADCVRLGVGNRDASFVAALITRLELEPKDEAARRLAARYLGVASDTSTANLRAWHERAKPYLFFTDKAGFQWRVDEAALAAGRPRARRGAVYTPAPASGADAR